MNSLNNVRRRIHEAGLPACVEGTLRKIFWKVYLTLLVIRVKFRCLISKGKTQVDELRVIYIEPNQIKWSCPQPSIKYEAFGCVEGGDWDLAREIFEDTDAFIAFKSHFLVGIPLVKTRAYAKDLKTIEGGDSPGL